MLYFNSTNGYGYIYIRIICILAVVYIPIICQAMLFEQINNILPRKDVYCKPTIGNIFDIFFSNIFFDCCIFNSGSGKIKRF